MQMLGKRTKMGQGREKCEGALQSTKGCGYHFLVGEARLRELRSLSS